MFDTDLARYRCLQLRQCYTERSGKKKSEMTTTETTPATLATWAIDPYHNFAQFTVKHMMIATVTGRLGAVTGTLRFDGSDLTTGSVEATIDVSGLRTGNEMREHDLRSPNFFHVSNTLRSASKARASSTWREMSTACTATSPSPGRRGQSRWT